MWTVRHSDREGFENPPPLSITFPATAVLTISHDGIRSIQRDRLGAIHPTWQCFPNHFDHFDDQQRRTLPSRVDTDQVPGTKRAATVKTATGLMLSHS